MSQVCGQAAHHLQPPYRWLVYKYLTPVLFPQSLLMLVMLLNPHGDGDIGLLLCFE